MTERKKKLRIIQISLLTLGMIIIFFTYYKSNTDPQQKILSKEVQDKVKSQLKNKSNEGDVFYNIEYSGLDLAGNRYILKSLEAYNNQQKQEVVMMKTVEATFYFKDNKILYVWSDNGKYNNRSLDMYFEGNLKAIYEETELFADNAEYSNSKSFLTITNNVKIKDIRGTMFADKLLFDIKKQTLNIASFNDNKINANMKLK